MAAILLTPAPERPAVIYAAPPPPVVKTAVAAVEVPGPGPVSVPIAVDPAMVATAILGLAGIASLVRATRLAWRSRRLWRLVRQSRPTHPELQAAVLAEARRLGLCAPRVRLGETGGDVLLAGLIRPVLVMSRTLEEAPGAAVTHAVIRHELAHLKRGDHRVIWLEEAVLTLLAANPVLPWIRVRRSAAREEACDALALKGSRPEARRAYARRLIETLKAEGGAGPTPALTFGGQRKTRFERNRDMKAVKSLATRRVSSILTPPAKAGRGARLIAGVLGLAMASVACAGSAAVAMQRERTAPLVLEEQANLPAGTRDGAWRAAAMDVIYRSAWPEACGFGADDGKVYVHLGDGCTSSSVANPEIETLGGVDPLSAPRDAFAAVKTACDAGRPVLVAYRQNGIRRTISATCAADAVAPRDPRMFEVALSFQDLEPRSGDRLEIDLVRNSADVVWRKGLAFDLGDLASLPAQVRGEVQPELFDDGESPTMTARIVGADGKLRASSSGPQRPMIVSEQRALAFATLRAVEPAKMPKASAPAPAPAPARIVAMINAASGDFVSAQTPEPVHLARSGENVGIPSGQGAGTSGARSGDIDRQILDASFQTAADTFEQRMRDLVVLLSDPANTARSREIVAAYQPEADAFAVMVEARLTGGSSVPAAFRSPTKVRNLPAELRRAVEDRQRAARLATPRPRHMTAEQQRGAGLVVQRSPWRD